MKYDRLVLLCVIALFSGVGFTADLTQSMIVQENKAMEDVCQQLIKKTAETKDSSKPLIYHLVTDQTVNRGYWQPYIKYLFNGEKLQPEDVYFVVKENSAKVYLKDDSVFKYLIVDNLANGSKPEYQRRMVSLLTNIKLHNAGYMSDEHHKSCGSQSASEYYSVLGKIVEEGHHEALKSILSVWPTTLAQSLWLNDAISREERTGGNYMQGYKYEVKKYSVATWLLRSKEGQHHLYLDNKQHGKPNYIKAGQEVVRHAWEKREHINSALFAIAAVLEKNSQLPNSVDLAKWVERLSETVHIQKEALSIPQRVMLGNKFQALN